MGHEEDAMKHSPRSQSIVTLTLLIALSALAGCKGGGGGSQAASSSAPSAGATAPDASGNHAPTIGGSAPTSAAANAGYSFKPTASDVDGDAVTFQIQNKPSWATFSTVTGQLSGTPTLAQAGQYANIVITASDGKASATLPAFTVTVSQQAVAGASGTTSLSWVAPTQNTDGSPLTNLAGFIIVYGASSNELSQSVQIDNPSVDSYVLQDLPAGTYYFGIKAYNQNGEESAVSTTVTKQIG
jgi:hypothetical protein